MLQIQDRVRGVSLRNVFPQGQFVGAHDIRVNSCCADSRSCQPGDAFFAQVEADSDGHDYVRQAIERGASAVVAERLLPIRVPQCIVGDSNIAYGRVCQALAGDPSGLLRSGCDRQQRKNGDSAVDCRHLQSGEAKCWHF